MQLETLEYLHILNVVYRTWVTVAPSISNEDTYEVECHIAQAKPSTLKSGTVIESVHKLPII